MTTEIRVEPVPWFAEDEYRTVRAVMSDGKGLPERYDIWRQAAETAERDAVESGLAPVRVVLSPGKFVGWCSERMMFPTADARHAYASWVLRGNRGRS